MFSSPRVRRRSLSVPHSTPRLASGRPSRFDRRRTRPAARPAPTTRSPGVPCRGIVSASGPSAWGSRSPHQRRVMESPSKSISIPVETATRTRRLAASGPTSPARMAMSRWKPSVLIRVRRLPRGARCAYDERWPGRRIGLRGDTTRAPTQGPRPKGAARCRPVFPFGIGTKAVNRAICVERSLYLISRPRFLHFTVNHYTTGDSCDSATRSRPSPVPA